MADSDVITTTDHTVADEFRATLGEIGGEEAEVLERRGIDAGAAQWVVVAGMTWEGCGSSPTSSCSTGSWTRSPEFASATLIDNPTPDLVERVLAGRGSPG